MTYIKLAFFDHFWAYCLHVRWIPHWMVEVKVRVTKFTWGPGSGWLWRLHHRPLFDPKMPGGVDFFDAWKLS